MPVTYRILPERGLVYVRYVGFAALPETNDLLTRYMADPDRRPGQKQLVDLSEVTGFERDFVSLMAVQARKAEAFVQPGAQTLLVYYAPHDAGFEMARLRARSWLGISSVVATIQRDATAALDILAQPERDMAALLATAR